MILLVFAVAGCRPKDDTAEAPSCDVLTLGPVVPCDDPGPLAYDDVGAARGLTGSRAGTEHLESGGDVAWDDLDGDGLLDVSVAFRGEPVRMYLRRGDVYEEQTGYDPRGDDDVGLPWTPSIADLDGDGLEDVVWAGHHPAVLWNEGGGVYTTQPLDDVVSLAMPVVARQLEPIDFDRDGRLDLYVVVGDDDLDDGDEVRADLLLMNRGDRRFERRPDLVPPAGARQGFYARAYGQTADGTAELFVVNDMLDGDVLYSRRPGSLADVTGPRDAGLVQNGMGADVADVDGDGLLDVYATDAFVNRLLRQLPDGTFVDATEASGLRGLQTGMSWGARFGDADNDGWTDLAVAEGDLWYGTDEPLPFDLLHNDGAGVFSDLGTSLGLPRDGSFRGVVAADDNGDGVLDWLVSDVVGAPRLFESRSCTVDAWLEVDAPLGSRVEVEAGGRVQSAFASHQSGVRAAGPSRVHFGLGDADTVDRLTVTTPDGESYECGGFSPRRIVGR